MFKMTNPKKLKKVYSKLIGKNFYYFRNKADSDHKGMHNLSGFSIKPHNIVHLNGAN